LIVAAAASVAALACAVAAVAASAAGGITTSAAASAAANAINVRPGDLPSPGAWKAYPAQSASALHQYDAREAKCYGGRYASVLADIASKAFSRGADTIVSDVEVFRTAALAATDFKAFGSPHGIACSTQLLRQSYAAGHAVKAATASIHSPAAGTAATFAVRVTLQYENSSGKAQGQAFVTDQIEFLEGQAEISFSVSADNSATPQTPPVSLERTLTALLVARAKTTLG